MKTLKRDYVYVNELPSADHGLGDAWMQTDEWMAHEPGTSAPLLGYVVGPRENHFDPGKMGSYFQSAEDVKRSLEIVARAVRIRPGWLPLLAWQALLSAAARAGIGIYVTF